MHSANLASGGETEHTARDYFNPWRILCERLPHMINEAQDARLEALENSATTARPANHRGFYVGSSVLAVDEHLRSDRTETAINTMPREAGPRVCAEKRVVARIEKANRVEKAAYWIPGIVVVGPPQQDRATEAKTNTLWPCGETCWPNIVAKKLESDTLVVTVKPDKRHGQVQTAEELISFYENVRDGRSAKEPPVFDLGEKPRSSDIVDRFDEIIPRTMDVLASPETRMVAVNAAKVAIQGFASLRLV